MVSKTSTTIRATRRVTPISAILRVRCKPMSANLLIRVTAMRRSAWADEFISMHLDARDGEKVMERVHTSHPFVSAGWVLCNGLTLDQALTQADKALYANKEGRKKKLAHTAGE